MLCYISSRENVYKCEEFLSYFSNKLGHILKKIY